MYDKLECWLYDSEMQVLDEVKEDYLKKEVRDEKSQDNEDRKDGEFGKKDVEDRDGGEDQGDKIEEELDCEEVLEDVELGDQDGEKGNEECVKCNVGYQDD